MTLIVSVIAALVLTTAVFYALCVAARNGDRKLEEHENEMQDWGTTLPPDHNGELIHRMQDSGQIR